MNLKIYTLLLACSFVYFGQSLTAQEWETLANIPEGLTFPVVTVLDGKIHVIGGGGGGGATDVHYAYDPVTDTWETLAPVPYLAQQPAGASAAGKIHYFGGGYPNSGTPLDDHYIYDPGTDTWTQAASLTAPRAIHYGASINDTVYTMAGQGMTTLFEAYDPVSDSWSARANLPDGFFMYSARCTVNEKIYRFGGGGYSAPNNYASVYDPYLNEWSGLPNFPVAIHAMEGSAVGESIYLTGGYYNAFTTNEVWIYDIISETYYEGPAMPIERNYHSVVTLGECIYVVGGYHPIFPDSVRVSLMRFCPYGIGTKAPNINSWELVRFRTGQGNIKIEFPSSFLGKEVYINVYDILGRNVYSSSVSEPQAKSFTFSTNRMNKSIHIIKLSTKNDFYVKKFYINN